ncbi:MULTISPECIES: methyltransferase family protein [Providencia]|uniref:methyltransferase family protein n=1 Tax=Providencia TaxID=586 RepID=UPI0015EB808E|nr:MULTISPECIES: isoprenylcysteine carboxylmethyltransferase family protein [Providencia]EJD6537992.1 isoprenylcysteine carboxylmethyltransferase family protein [Providencia rettgeri]ELQ1456318.1 isoprenylcysteine carboxylmethyltransferase family protein [Providencia rettgeri]ELR5137649.1 isoprenylcysteine carboxylmethyltransferase family protein [Providencia rettgeri]ELR5167132.1 isoprenylcysteine carboxylmethyltransferase family protein [Providencia rettgeri]ELR5185489.1 isoprenylcysteine ca
MKILKFPLLNWLIVNGVAVYFLFKQGALDWYFSGWLGVLGILVALESVSWVATSLFYFYKHKTSPNPSVRATHLITNGPYRLSRNPMYLAFTSMSLALALLTHSPYFLVSGLVFWLVTDLYTIPQEENFLAKSFKAEWDSYHKQTRRWL